MKQLYSCPPSLRGLINLTKTGMALALTVFFVLTGTASNTYFENDAKTSTLSNEGSSVNNLLNLTAKLNAAEAFYSFTSETDTKGNLGGECPCPENEGPVLSIESETFALQCPEDVPEPPVVTATDACDGDVDVVVFPFSTQNGDITCSAQDAIGQNPDYWAIWLPSLPNGLTDQWRFTEDGSFNEYPDNTAVLTGTVASVLNPDNRFKVHIKIDGNYDWPTWNSMLTLGNPITNRIYKDANGFGILNNNFETWSYYVIDPTQSYLVGEGDLEGSYLMLQQAPSNLLFGAQVGLGANDTNGNYGMSSWFTYTGFLPDADGQLVATSGQGDVNVDLDCGTPEYQCASETEYTYVAIDQCGVASSATLTYDVEDTMAPELSGCPENVTVQCDNIPLPATVTAIDNCIGEVEVSYSEAIEPGTTCPQEMTITRVWAAEDSCGNRNECLQIITVVDTTSPILEEAPADMTVECGSPIPPMADLTATDNCDADVEVFPSSSTSNDVQCPMIEVITRTWTAYDDCGNSSSVSQTIYIQDSTSPDILCPADATVECGTSSSPDVTGSAIATDICSTAQVEYTDSNPTEGCPSTFERTWTAVDECGNTSSCVQVITIDDTIAPVVILENDDAEISCGEFTCGYDVLLAYAAGELNDDEEAAARACAAGLFAELGLTPVGVEDNCADDLGWTETSLDLVVLDECEEGLVAYITCNFQATDECGNSSEIVSSTIYII